MTYYNSYKKRHYNLSPNQKKKYSQEMNELETYSSHLDSIYHQLDNCKIRISNHKPTSAYHDMSDNTSNPIVDIRISKLRFISFIENHLSEIEEAISQLNLSYYRYIKVDYVGKVFYCFLKGYKTKKVELFY